VLLLPLPPLLEHSACETRRSDQSDRSVHDVMAFCRVCSCNCLGRIFRHRHTHASWDSGLENRSVCLTTLLFSFLYSLAYRFTTLLVVVRESRESASGEGTQGIPLRLENIQPAPDEDTDWPIETRDMSPGLSKIAGPALPRETNERAKRRTKGKLGLGALHRRRGETPMMLLMGMSYSASSS